MAESSRAPLHALDMIPVCPTCLEMYKKSKRYTKQLRTWGCFDPYAHPSDATKWPLAVMYEQSGHLQEVRPMPEVSLTGHFIMCHYLTVYRRGRGCKKKDRCTYAHSKLELKAWNRALKRQGGREGTGGGRQPRPRASTEFITPDDPLPRNPPARYNNGEMSQAAPYYNLPPLSSLNRGLLEAPITYDSYQDKFHTLLYYEEHEHEKVLRERCDGKYMVTTYLHQDGNIHGQIHGMTSTNVAYAIQAANDVKLFLPLPSSPQSIKGSINKKYPDDMYFTITISNNARAVQFLAKFFPQMLKQTTELFTKVQFVLKHTYFANNHRSLENLHPSVISKLVPRKEDLELSLRQIRHIRMPPIDLLTLDKEYQFLALQKILGCSSNAIFLVIGPFGTGKTRLLATAAYNILKQPNTRVLICTCHIQSADSYIEDYFGPMMEQNLMQGIDPVRLITERHQRHGEKKRKYNFDFTTDVSGSPKSLQDLLRSRIVVTTFLTTIRLHNYNPQPYTHILIDEGAQSREPEAVAPLGLADEHTKIVIAGDHMQIGPQVLVLGEEAETNGLATSLLLRIHNHYESLSREHDQTINHLTTPLLTNYRCHDTILRLPSVLFFESTLQARSTSHIHPSCISALEFVCTSFDQTKLYKCQDYDSNEVVIILAQVEQYLDKWPVAEWGPVNYSQICIVSPSPTQINKIRQYLKKPKFSSLQGITTLRSFELQGREFRAVFISALEATTASGATMNPTKSICDQYVFNTIITRAQSLVVCVGNPFLLLSIESHTGQKQCWREYLKRCLEVSSLKIAPQCRDAFPDCQSKIHALYLKVFGDLQSFLAAPHKKVDDTVADSILDAYKRAFQALPECRKLKVTLGKIANGDRGYTVEVDKGNSSEDEEETPISNNPNCVECYLQCDSYRLSWGVPIDPKKDPIKIQGIDNRRQAFDGARVQVSLYKDIERSGYVTRVIEQGPQWQYICTVDEHNSILFSPIDHKNPRFVNLPGLSRGLLLKAGNVRTIKKELEVRQHSVAVFDPTSFTNPNINRDDDEENIDIEIPQIKDVIPLNIARRLLFVVWCLNWEKSRRYPLGVVVAALPKGLTFFHAERLLCTQHNISAPNIRITPEIEAQLSAAPSVVDVGNVYNNAIIIEQPDVAFSIEFIKEYKDGAVQFMLGVHVANVARFLNMDSPIDQLACHRGTSLRNFGPNDKQHPMLPPSVLKKWGFSCSKLLSAISVSCKIHFDGKPTLHSESTTIEESCVCPNITLSYSEVQQILEKQFLEGCEAFKGDTKETKIGLLYSIAKHLCCKRLQCSVPVLDASKDEEFPHAYFLVNELMVWMNRSVAEYMLSRPPSFPSILHKQRKPNISQFANIVKKHVAVLPFHPLLKMLPQSPHHIAKPFLLEQSCFIRLQEALVQKKCIKAREILLELQNQPQVAVACKELSLTEPSHQFVCSSVLQEMSPLKLDLNAYMMPAEDDKVSPYAHHGLHCLSSHITSPLQSYLDIVGQRLFLNALNGKELYSYTPEKLTSLCKSCQVKQDSAAHCEQSISQLKLTLSLAECAQPFRVFVGTVKEDPNGASAAQGDKNTIRKGRLQLVFPDPALHWLDDDQRSVTISSIVCGNSKIHFKDGCYKSTWSAKVTSFLHSSSTDFYHDGSCYISKGDTAVIDDNAKTMIFMVPSRRNDAKNSPLVKEPYTVKPNNPVVSIPAKDWNSIEQFMKSPCETTSVPLLKALDKLPSIATPKATILHSSTEFISTINGSSMWLYNGQLSIEPYKVLKIWLSASYARPLLTPTIQLLEVAPFLNICVQHNTAPASCFASPILSNASKVKYNSIKEYVSLWEDVLLAEASVQSIKEAEMKVIHDVQLKWPALKQPESSVDDVYFVPDGKIVFCPTDEFLSMSKDFFIFDVGDLVCVRYKVPMSSKIFKDHCTSYGLKDDKGYVVFHLVVYEIGKDVTGVTTDIFLKFASPQTTRISALMKDYLMANRHCELQLIPLNVSHRRVYKSLRSLLSPPHTINKKLVFDIALGNITAHGASMVDQSQVSHFKRHQIDPVLKLWPPLQNSRSLNDSQLYSIMLAIKNEFQLIQGPPGTGKSVTGAHLAYAFVHKNRSKALVTDDGRIKCVLVCGPSNKSVDVVLDLLLQLGDPNLRLLRIYGSSIESKDHVGPYHNKEVFIDIGTDQVCRPDHRSYALHWLVRSPTSCRQHRHILNMDEEFARLAREKKVPSVSSRENYRKIMRQAEDEIFHHGYDVVLCTCNEASSSRVTRNIAPVQVIIDEAAMATEPESMVAIKLASEHVTLIGDHMQLQPVIDYQQAAEFGLGTSLFERYAAPPQQKAKQSVPARRPAPTQERHFLRLNVQYRMHWRICEFPSKMFYDYELQTDHNITAGFIQIKKFWPQGRDNPLVFCNIDGREGGAVSGNKKSSLLSKSNADEAKKVAQIVEVLHKVKRISQAQIAVLTPYTSQKDVIANTLQRKGLTGVTVQTVTESQGREFGFVILSTVRSQPRRTISNRRAVQPDRKWLLDHLGFVTDKHQICVGITRAKHGLIVVGNKALLDYDDTWHKLITHYSDNGYVRSDKEFPSVEDLQQLRAL